MTMPDIAALCEHHGAALTTPVGEPDPIALLEYQAANLWRDRDQWRALAEKREKQLAAAVRETAETQAELDAVRKNRLISAIFGHHRDAPKPFALYRREDETGISGTGVVALGAEFPDGMVVLRWTSAFPTSVVFHERGIESVEAVHGHGGKTQVVWLSDEFEPLAEAERKIEALSAEVAGLREQLTQSRAERQQALDACDRMMAGTLSPSYIIAEVRRALDWDPIADRAETEPA